MKNSTRLFYFVSGAILLLLLIVPLIGLAQEPSVATSGGFFSKVKDWFGREFWITVIGVVGGILGNKGYNRKLKMVARQGSIYLKGVGNILTHAGETLDQVDNSIRDDDSIDARGLHDAIFNKGKNVYMESEDFIVSIKPKAVAK